jgi:hypothetical protein
VETGVVASTTGLVSLGFLALGAFATGVAEAVLSTTGADAASAVLVVLVVLAIIILYLDDYFLS